MSEITLGQRIRQRRKQIGLNQSGLSKAASVSGSSISLWENDNTAPRGANLHKLATALQCSPAWILYGNEEETPCEPLPMSAQIQLTEDELELLKFYRSLPESEQKVQKGDMKAKVEDFSRLFTELIKVRKRNN